MPKHEASFCLDYRREARLPSSIQLEAMVVTGEAMLEYMGGMQAGSVKVLVWDIMTLATKT